MMRQRAKRAWALATAATLMIAFAPIEATADQATPALTFTGFRNAQDGSANIYVTTTIATNPAGCDNTQQFDLEPGGEGHTQRVAVALAAFLANKTIAMDISGTTCSATDNPLAVAIFVAGT